MTSLGSRALIHIIVSLSLYNAVLNVMTNIPASRLFGVVIEHPKELSEDLGLDAYFSSSGSLSEFLNFAVTMAKSHVYNSLY